MRGEFPGPKIWVATNRPTTTGSVGKKCAQIIPRCAEWGRNIYLHLGHIYGKCRQIMPCIGYDLQGFIFIHPRWCRISEPSTVSPFGKGLSLMNKSCSILHPKTPKAKHIFWQGHNVAIWGYGHPTFNRELLNGIIGYIWPNYNISPTWISMK